MPEIKIVQNLAGKPEVNNGTINIKVSPPKVPVVVKNPNENTFKFNLNFRRALNGDYMIFEHADIDIIIMLKKKKVVAFAKDMMSEVVYGAENRLFNFLRRKGIIAFDSIQGGNVYGSLEGLMLEAKEDAEPQVIDYLLYQIHEWIKTEKPYYESVEAHDEMMDDMLLEPDDEYSTELGEVPHEEKKGSIEPRTIFGGHIYGKNTY